MLGRNLHQKSAHPLWVTLGFLCCALLVLGGIVQAGHIHQMGRRFSPTARSATRLM